MRMKGFLKLHDFASKTGFVEDPDKWSNQTFPPNIVLPMFNQDEIFLPKNVRTISASTASPSGKN